MRARRGKVTPICTSYPWAFCLSEEAAVTAASGLSPADLADLNGGSFIVDNLVPVTLGSIVGGALLVGLVYWVIYLWPRRRAAGAATVAGSELEGEQGN